MAPGTLVTVAPGLGESYPMARITPGQGASTEDMILTIRDLHKNKRGSTQPDTRTCEPRVRHRTEKFRTKIKIMADEFIFLITLNPIMHRYGDEITLSFTSNEPLRHDSVAMEPSRDSSSKCLTAISEALFSADYKTWTRTFKMDTHAPALFYDGACHAQHR